MEHTHRQTNQVRRFLAPLMGRRGFSQLLDLILYQQFPPLQFGNGQIVHRRMHQCFVYLLFDLTMFLLQLSQMRFKRHRAVSLSVVPRLPPQSGKSDCDRAMVVCHERLRLSNFSVAAFRRLWICGNRIVAGKYCRMTVFHDRVRRLSIG